MGKSSKKKTKGLATRAASTSEIPDEKSDMDEGNLDDSSSPEPRRRKLPAVPATHLPTTQSSPGQTSEDEQAEEQTEMQPERIDGYIVYMKGTDQDIIAAVRTQDVKFAREIESLVGPIVLMKFRNASLRISCRTEQQKQQLYWTARSSW